MCAREEWLGPKWLTLLVFKGFVIVIGWLSVTAAAASVSTPSLVLELVRLGEASLACFRSDSMLLVLDLRSCLPVAGTGAEVGSALKK